MVEPLWPVGRRLHEVQRTPVVLDLEADAERRAVIAEALDLIELKRFVAHVRITPWLDGARIDANWEAEIVQTCGVTLDPFETPLASTFLMRLVPADSPAMVPASSDVFVDPDAEDPPDALEGDEIDLGGYLVEHLALEIDPFPRKPGASFEPPAPEGPASPFAVLQSLKPPGKKG